MNWKQLCAGNDYLTAASNTLAEACVVKNVIYHRLVDKWSFTVKMVKRCSIELWFALQTFFTKASFCQKVTYEVDQSLHTIGFAYHLLNFVSTQNKAVCQCLLTLSINDISFENNTLHIKMSHHNYDHTQLNVDLLSVFHKCTWDMQKVIWETKKQVTTIQKLNDNYETTELYSSEKPQFTGTIFKIDTIRLTKNNIFICYLVNKAQQAMAVSMSHRLYKEQYQINTLLHVTGKWEQDKYAQLQRIKASKIEIIPPEEPLCDKAKTKRIELHLHTKMSVMDGISSPAEYFALADQYEHEALAFVDHDNVQAYPDIFACAQKYPHIKAIYGVELNVINKHVPYIKNPQHQHFEHQKIVVFDLETTGLNPASDEIIEFGAIVYDNMNANGVNVDFLIKPSKPLNDFTINLTHITNEMLANEPSISEVAPQIFTIIQNAVLVAHNADFDMSFLHKLAQKYHQPPLTNMVVDTLRLAWALIANSKNYRLGTVAKKLNITYNEQIAHRADYDAQVLAKIFLSFLDQMRAVHNINYFDEINNVHQDEVYKRLRSKHITVLAKNNAGIKSIFALVSQSHTQTYFRQPKIFREQLQPNLQIRQNLLIGSSCLHNEIWEYADDEQLLQKALLFYDYIEIQPLHCYDLAVKRKEFTQEQLIKKIKTIIQTAQKCQIPVIVSGDVHYAKREQSIFRDIYIHNKGIGGVRHNLYDRRYQQPHYPVQAYENTAAMKEAFAFLEDEQLIHQLVVTNPHLLNKQISKVTITKDKLYTPTIDEAETKLWQVCYENAHQRYGKQLPSIIADRLEQELSAICHHKYAVIYWIAYCLVKQSLADGFLVGSRGSVGSSVVAYMADITEVNPLPPHYRCQCGYSQFSKLPSDIRCGYDLKPQPCPQCKAQMVGDGHNIPFATFLGFNADKVPDIDLNFSGVYQNIAHDFIKEMFGDKAVFRAGTISTVAEKTAFGYVKNYLELTQQQDKYNYYQILYLAQGCVGVKRTTGQHPGGIIIIPKTHSVLDFTPYNYPADDQTATWYTTHFDFNSLHDNLLKLDILGHLDPTALKMLHDLTSINPKDIPFYDPEIVKLFRSSKVLQIANKKLINNETTGAISIPEFGTSFVRQMLKETQPKSFADLVQISGLSHGTDVWRGIAQQLIKEKVVNISNVIGCRDDIMTTLITAGVAESKAFAIMEQVRKGKGINEADSQLLLDHKIPAWYIASCQKIQYLFPKAHATAYVLMAWRIAWYKVHYPYEYYATFLSTRVANFNWKMFLETDYTKIITAISNLRKLENNKAKDHELIVLYEVLLEMKARHITIKNVDLAHSAATDFVIHEANNTKAILLPFTVVDGLGATVAENIVTKRKEQAFQSYDDFKKRTSVNITSLQLMKEMQVFTSLHSNQMNLFD